VRKGVIEEDIQLSDNTNAITAGAIDRNDRFDAQLGLVSNVYHSGIDRADCLFTAIEVARLRS
jgi:hypothetical protein